MPVPAMETVVVALVIVGPVVNMAVKPLSIDVWGDVVIGSLSNVMIGLVVTLAFVVPVSYFVTVSSGAVVEALAVEFSTEVLLDVNVNVLTDVMTALDFPMSIP